MHTSAWGYAHCYFLLTCRYVGMFVIFCAALYLIICAARAVAGWVKRRLKWS